MEDAINLIILALLFILIAAGPLVERLRRRSEEERKREEGVTEARPVRPAVVRTAKRETPRPPAPAQVEAPARSVPSFEDRILRSPQWSFGQRLVICAEILGRPRVLRRGR